MRFFPLLLTALAACAVPAGQVGVGAEGRTLRVMTFNILQGGGDASNVGFDDAAFGGSRLPAIAAAVHAADADVVGVQEDASGDGLLAALGPEWRRAGNVYARLPLELLERDGPLTAARVRLDDERSVVVVNTHWSPSPYGPYLAQERWRSAPPEDAAAREALAAELLAAADKPDGPRGYRHTLERVAPLVAAGEAVVLTGDFNEPSHLDWTPRAAREGADRWVDNPTGRPLRLAVPWRGSRELAALGFRDAYRVAHPDEVRRPGNTWTPPYPEGTPGRRPWGEQVLDRIDWVLVAGPAEVRGAAVVGEAPGVADLVPPGPWPSDHRAVVATIVVP